jgi:hypothetical protein
MRFRSANISVAASRTTVRRRIVELSEPGPRRSTPGCSRHHDAKSTQEALAGFFIKDAGVTDRAVKAAPPGGLRPALTALLYLYAPRRVLKSRSREHLTSRSTSDPPGIDLTRA